MRTRTCAASPASEPPPAGDARHPANLDPAVPRLSTEEPGQRWMLARRLVCRREWLPPPCHRCAVDATVNAVEGGGVGRICLGRMDSDDWSRRTISGMIRATSASTSTARAGQGRGLATRVAAAFRHGLSLLGVAARGQAVAPRRPPRQPEARPAVVTRRWGCRCPTARARSRTAVSAWRSGRSARPRRTPRGQWTSNSDTTADHRKLKLLKVVDEFTRECSAVVADGHIDADKVVATLDAIALTRGAPAFVRFDNGAEFIAQAVMDWCRLT